MNFRQILTAPNQLTLLVVNAGTATTVDMLSGDQLPRIC